MVGGDRRLAGTLIVTVVFNLFGWPYNSLVPVVAQEHLRLGPEAVGLLVGMDGVGAFRARCWSPGWCRPRPTGGATSAAWRCTS